MTEYKQKMFIFITVVTMVILMTLKNILDIVGDYNVQEWPF